MSEGESQKPFESLEEAFAAFRQAWYAGEHPVVDAFLESCSTYGDELRQRIENFLMVAGAFPDPEDVEEGKTSQADADGNKSARTVLGDFRILHEIGRGGMGIVYEAEQISLGRKVALKVLPVDLGLSDDAVLKFRREAEAGGRQSHPGIVSVYSTGEQDGRYYIAQELVEGGCTLADRLDDLRKGNELPRGYFREAAELTAKVADALEHAHASGVIHRDIKPSNILLTAEKQPKITDFGLAKVEDAMALSRTGDFAGTPYYMSPEQVTGSRKAIDRRTDIYSLGVTFYEMLTLRQPFEGNSSFEVLKKIPVVEPPDPWRINPRVPRDLSVICLKAMEKSPDRRYQTVREFVEDLERFLAGEVVLARPASAATKIMKRVKRNPVLSGAVGVAALAILALMIWVVVYFVQMKIKYEENIRHSDLSLVYRLKVEAEDLWPAYPWKEKDLSRWLEEARGLLSRSEQYQSEFSRLASTGQISAQEAELKDFIEKLNREIDSLGTDESGLIMDVTDRLRFAETIYEESIEKYRDEWDEAIMSIADESTCPQYGGLTVDPIIGIVPIGRDLTSGLWEFAHLQTGEIPVRASDGRLVFTDETGLVFVLIPGGSFRMGSMLPDEQHPEGAPHVDPNCLPGYESPVREVRLDPFLISKYEMTQGQWLRFTGDNPSTYTPERDQDIGISLRNPIEMVNWHDCVKALKRLNLILPTEAQWEYACRAGTTKVWYTGNDPNSLQGYENFADAARRRLEKNYVFIRSVEWDDGFPCHAPVGSFLPNPFGLHDMAGNVKEWCRDPFAVMRKGNLSPGNGLRIDLEGDSIGRPLRGGMFTSWTLIARTAKRENSLPGWADRHIGVRPAMKGQ